MADQCWPAGLVTDCMSLWCVTQERVQLTDSRLSLEAAIVRQGALRDQLGEVRAAGGELPREAHLITRCTCCFRVVPVDARTRRTFASKRNRNMQIPDGRVSVAKEAERLTMTARDSSLAAWSRRRWKVTHHGYARVTDTRTRGTSCCDLDGNRLHWRVLLCRASALCEIEGSQEYESFCGMRKKVTRRTMMSNSMQQVVDRDDEGDSEVSQIPVWCRSCGANLCGKRFGPIWARGIVCVCAQLPRIGTSQGSMGRIASSSSSI